MWIEKHNETESSTVCFDELEKWVRVKAQHFLQGVLEEKVTTFFGRVENRSHSIRRIRPITEQLIAAEGLEKMEGFPMFYINKKTQVIYEIDFSNRRFVSTNRTTDGRTVGHMDAIPFPDSAAADRNLGEKTQKRNKVPEGFEVIQGFPAFYFNKETKVIYELVLPRNMLVPTSRTTDGRLVDPRAYPEIPLRAN